MVSPRPKTVLIAEDTAAIRTIISFLLRARGFEILEAADGNEALEKALAHRPDLLILDVLMPGKQGFEVCSYLKSNEETRSIPIIILSSITRDSGKSDEHWKRLSNADDFISKPFKAHDLLERIDAVLGKKSETGRYEKQEGRGGASLSR